MYAVFIASGFAFASWASRIPQVRDALELSPSDLGLVLLGVAVGSVISPPLAGVVVAKLGTGRTITVMSALAAAGLAAAALGTRSGVAWVLVGLVLLGLGNGTWDVAMNVEASKVERRLGLAIMPHVHAGFSVGTVAGALLGTGMVALGLLVSGALRPLAPVPGRS